MPRPDLVTGACDLSFLDAATCSVTTIEHDGGLDSTFGHHCGGLGSVAQGDAVQPACMCRERRGARAGAHFSAEGPPHSRGVSSTRETSSPFVCVCVCFKPCLTVWSKHVRTMWGFHGL